MVKFCIIEDDPVFLEAIQHALHFTPEYQCLVAADSMEAFWEALPERANVDILLLDIDLPGMSGIEALPKLCKRFPTTEIIMLTRIEDADTIIKALTLGATGYLLKGFPILNIREILMTVQKGGAAITPKIAKHIVQYLNPVSKTVGDIHLSDKENQILKFLSHGNDYHEASKLMNISVDGVRYHIKNIFLKLNVDNKSDALRIYQGLI